MITPIIMESEREEVGRKLRLLREQGQSRVHFDIGDGQFSEMISIMPGDLVELEINDLEIDLHLLVDDPMEYVEECMAVKPKRVIGQIERMGRQKIFLEAVAGYGAIPGLALKVETPIEEIEEDALGKCGVILLLAIPAGTTGSLFDERVIGKIKELRKIYSGSILIDGGINKTTMQRCLEAGANEVGANSAWWKGEFE